MSEKDLTEITIDGQTFKVVDDGSLFLSCQEIDLKKDYSKEEIIFPGEENWGKFGAVASIIPQVKRIGFLEATTKGYNPENFYIIQGKDRLTPLKQKDLKTNSI